MFQMGRSVDVAKSIKNNGKVKVSEARMLASYYLDALKEIDGLLNTISNLQGSETITFRGLDLVGKFTGVTSARNWRNAINASDRKATYITALLKDSLRVSGGRNNGLTGPAANVRAYLDLCEQISIALQATYDEGFRDGSSLLQRMASGDATITEYDKERP